MLISLLCALVRLTGLVCVSECMYLLMLEFNKGRLVIKSGPITAKGVSVAIRRYPKSSKNREVHVGVHPALRGARMGVPSRGRCSQSVAMCPDGHRRRSIIRALVLKFS